MNDIESIKFLFNVLNWLRPNGYLHLRESCSESSTGILFYYYFFFDINNFLRTKKIYFNAQNN